jgi:hypothetical protein
MDWTVITSPIAGLLGVLVGAGISSSTTRRTHKERIAADHALAEQKIAADIDLAERKFNYDRDLAERKFRYDQEFNDHKRRVELAEEVLAGFLKLRDIIREIRSPAASGNEGEDRPAWAGETEEQAKARRIYFVPASRLLKQSDFINGLMAKRYQMNAYFGTDAEIPFGMIWEVLAHIQSAVRMITNSIDPQGRRLGDEAAWRRWESAIWRDSEDPDPHAETVESAIGRMETICRRVLGGRDE